MKTLHAAKITTDGKTITITADIQDVTFDPRFTQRQTFMHLNPDNIRHHRHIQGSHEAIFIKRAGQGIAVTHDFLVSLCTAIVPTTSFAPIAKAPLTNTLKVSIASELTPDLQWEQSADKGVTWTPIAGQTTDTLDKTTATAGNLVRLKATSEAGGMTTNAVKI